MAGYTHFINGFVFGGERTGERTGERGGERRGEEISTDRRAPADSLPPTGGASVDNDGLTLQSIDFWVKDGLFVSAAPSSEDTSGIQIVDLKGGLLSAGFFDIQCNGAFDIDFTDPSITVEAVLTVLRKLPAHGVTHIMATLITTDRDTYAHAIGVLLETISIQKRGDYTEPAARIVGIHLEGPFLHPQKKGAHREHLLRTPRPEGGSSDKVMTPVELQEVLQRTYGRDLPDDLPIVITVAPELRGALAFITACKERGILTSIGHTTATFEVAKAGITAGARLVTHLYNAMPVFSHREPGVIGLLGDRFLPQWYYGMICDGVHVHSAAVNIAFRSNPEGCILVTDGMRALGAGLGDKTYGEVAVTVHGGSLVGDGTYPGLHVVLKGTDVLAGAVAPLHSCVKNLQAATGCTRKVALGAASTVPRRALNVENPWLSMGSPADFIVVTADLDVSAAFIGGRCAEP